MKRIRLAGLTWPLPTDMTDAALEDRLFHPSGGPSRLVEARVKAAGFVPGNHADYEPGKRFYFTENNGVEIEVVSYA